MTTITDAIEQLKELARKDASLFVTEFGEALDPATTDWDAVAFADAVCALNYDARIALSHSDTGIWSTYQSALIAETKRLADNL